MKTKKVLGHNLNKQNVCDHNPPPDYKSRLFVFINGATLFVHSFSLFLYFVLKKMKRVRESGEAERREMVLVDHITETLPREMVREVFHNMSITMKERKQADGTLWHLNSVGRVSQLFYESITMVAQGLFKTLVKETRAEFEAWGGYVAGRPLSLHERFAESPLGHMGLSFPWCMRQFFQGYTGIMPNPNTMKREAGRLIASEIMYKSHIGGQLLDLVEWIFAPSKHIHPLSDLEPNVVDNPVSFADLYLYVRYAPFGEGTKEIIQSIDFLKDKETGFRPRSENETRFRNILARALVTQWLIQCLQHNSRPLFKEWLVYFHGRLAPMSNAVRGYFYNTWLYLLLDYPRTEERSPLLPFFLSYGYQLLETFLVQDSRELDSPMTSINDTDAMLQIGLLKLYYKLADFSRLRLQHAELSAAAFQVIWLTYLLRRYYGTINHYAYYVRNTIPMMRAHPVWEYLANLKARPNDPPQSVELKQILDNPPPPV